MNSQTRTQSQLARHSNRQSLRNRVSVYLLLFILLAVLTATGAAQAQDKTDNRGPATLNTGLKMLETCTVDIGDNFVVHPHKEGVLAKDKQGDLWISRKISSAPGSKLGFFPKESPAFDKPKTEARVKSPQDVSARYKWKSKWSLPFAGEGYTVTETTGKNGTRGHSVRLTEQGKGSIPTLGRDLLIDLPGSRNVRVEVDAAVGSTTYAGLTFKAPCTLDILKDCTVLTHKGNVVAFDEHKQEWRSQQVELEGKTVIAFFPASTAFSATTERPLGADLLPTFGHKLKGRNEVRIRNPNTFVVKAGIRSGNKGVDLAVLPGGRASVYVPDGEYKIYFVYSSKPDALFRGDDFTLKGNGVEIQIVKVVGGNYGIRQVK